MTVSVGVCVHSIDRSGAPGRPSKLTTPNPIALSDRAWRVNALSNARSPKANPNLPLLPSGNDALYARPASLNIGEFHRISCARVNRSDFRIMERAAVARRSFVGGCVPQTEGTTMGWMDDAMVE